MTRFLGKQFNYRSFNIILIFVFLLTLPVFKSIIRPGYFPMHDDFQAIRLLEIDKCIKDGQIPCRWVPDMGFGYGYPQFNYYAPTPYYIMEVFHLLGFGYLDSVKVFIVIITLLSAIGMFIFARSLWGNMGGLISSILYIYLPYRAVDIYVRGAIGELAAMAILPFVFWSAREIVLKNKKGIFWLAIFTFLFFTSHNITAFISIPFLLLWFIFLLFFHFSRLPLTLNESLKITRNFSIGFFWGLAMSAFFILPAWFEKKLVHIETMTSGYFNYLAHFLDIKQILFSHHWGYGSSQLGPNDDILLATGLLQWTLPLVALVLLFISKKRKQFQCVFFLIILGLVALIFTHSKSTFLWNSIPTLAFIQFPWRFLLLSGFIFSVAAGSLAELFSIKKAIFFSILLFVLTYALYGEYFKPKEWLSINDSNKFSGEFWTKQITASIYDYLPSFAQKAPDQEAAKEPTVVEGNGQIFSGSKGTNWQNWDVEVFSKQMKLQLQLFYFPNWKVLVDSVATDINYENELGLITVTLLQGKHKIEARLEDTPIRKAANTISILAFLPLLGLIMKRKILADIYDVLRRL